MPSFRKPIVMSCCGLLACAGSQSPAAEHAEADPKAASWSAVAPVAAMVLTHAVCTDPAIRACYQMTDAGCVMSVGDAVMGTTPPDSQPADAQAQRAWVTGPGQQAAVTAVQKHPRIKPCGAMGPVADVRVVLVEADDGGRPCVRLAGDPTPCTPARQAP